MDRDELLKRIWIDPRRCGGKPCIRGHHIWVSLILDLLAGGASVDEILVSHPGITREDIQACIAYAAEMSRERIVLIGIEDPAKGQVGGNPGLRNACSRFLDDFTSY